MQPPPVLMSAREALDNQVIKFKSSQEVVGEWIRQVGGLTRVGLTNNSPAIKMPMAKFQAPTRYEKQQEDAEKQENYATGTFLGVQHEL